MLDGAHTAADGQRHEAGLGGAGHDVEDDLAVLVTGGDVEKAQLIGAVGIVGASLGDRITGIDNVNKLNTLDHAAAADIEAGDDTGLKH